VDIQKHYAETTHKTAQDLRTMLRTALMADLAPLALPEVEEVVDRVAHMVPAGNVPGMILNNLARLTGRRVSANIARNDINQLMRGTEQTLDSVVYSTVFAGPAAVIWAYQGLLKLTGRNPEDAFPDGLWQFYTHYALREDTARHANETVGFDTRLRQHQLQLSPADRLTAWVMATITTLHHYPELLKNEWRERIYTHHLRELTRAAAGGRRFTRLYSDWEKQRPFGRGADSSKRESYPAYRRRKFDAFLEKAMQGLGDDLARRWVEQVNQAKAEALANYQNQMTILAYLEPDQYGETRVALTLPETRVGVIAHGQYYLLPICDPQRATPPDVMTVRGQMAALLAQPTDALAPSLTEVAAMTRAAFAGWRATLNEPAQQALAELRRAPILINTDVHSRALPLAEIRQAERGVGDHALTIFDTGESHIFDQSHIFFDGAWGAVLAEIVTQEALAWAVYLHTLPAPPVLAAPARWQLPLTAAERFGVRAAPRVLPEAAAETDLVNVKAILSLRTLFKLRSDLLDLTVNDLLVLYRAVHAVTYTPDPEVVAAVQALPTPELVELTLKALEPTPQAKSAVLIPVDASQHTPRDRVYPMTIEVPLEELDLINLYQQALQTLEAYQGATGDRSKAYEEFDALQRRYLAALAGFGLVLARVKDNALRGGSDSMSSIKLLANFPPSVQRWLDKIPHRFDVLNDLIKGREVFSNVGAVPKHASLTRFGTAKDDNEKKELAWGVVTDAQGVMRVTLRDFRPHIRALLQAGYRALAIRLTQDYLESYAGGLNAYIRNLHRITQFSRETRLERPADLA